MDDKRPLPQFLAPWPRSLQGLGADSLPNWFPGMYSLRRYLTSEMWSEGWPGARRGTEGWAYARDSTLAWWGMHALRDLFEQLDKREPRPEYANLAAIYRHLGGLIGVVHAPYEQQPAIWSPAKLIRRREALDPALETSKVYGWVLQEVAEESEFANLYDFYRRYLLAVGNALWLAHATATMHVDEPAIGQFWYHIKELFLGVHEGVEGE